MEHRQVVESNLKRSLEWATSMDSEGWYANSVTCESPIQRGDIQAITVTWDLYRPETFEERVDCLTSGIRVSEALKSICWSVDKRVKPNE